MAIELYEHQKIALEELKSGKILCGGVGSGKSITALAYYYTKECEGKIQTNKKGGFSPMKKPKDLYIITTAQKRDKLEWEQECISFLLSPKPEFCSSGVKVIIDSWNNIQKYSNIKDAFFIFDEQRVVGKGAWVKAFIKISQKNNWLLLSATPGDTWIDYIPVFIANGFYKNKTEFERRHVVFNRFSKYPKVDRYLEVSRLIRIRDSILVDMQYAKKTKAHDKVIIVDFDKELFDTVMVKRWNPYMEKPVKDIGELCYLMRRVVNSAPERLDAVKDLVNEHKRSIIFYNFNYELDLLLELGNELGITTKQWNGHKHEQIPETESWIYLVQYAAGSEGWNCIETNVVIFYSQNYSFKATAQAAGRIDRINTPFSDLYYYYVRSNSTIDLAIFKALKTKKKFNEHRFMAI